MLSIIRAIGDIQGLAAYKQPARHAVLSLLLLALQVRRHTARAGMHARAHRPTDAAEGVFWHDMCAPMRLASPVVIFIHLI